MVFPSDPHWRQEYAKCSGTDAARNVRFRSWGTEELLVRCIMKYMPWLRRIHLLLASESQVQPWMRTIDHSPLTIDHSSVGVSHGDSQCSMFNVQCSIVFHRDFIPAEHLPCFNVNTIEMHLHRIPDLAEHFIYSNDDFFPLSPLKEEDFFQHDLPCQRMEEKPYPASPNIFHRFVMNGLNMVAADFGKHFTTTWLKGGHSMQPMLRSTVEKVCTLHADRISKSFTFARTDRNFNQYIFPFYQHFTGQYIDHAPRRVYVGPKADINKVVEVIRDPNAGIVCINDNEKIEDWEHRASVVRSEISGKLARQVRT